MADPAMPKVGDVVADKYEILQLIGEGGMGSVFLASHNLTQKRVALKWMLPELARNEDAVQRFIREAQAAGRIAHPNVVDIYDVGEHQDSYFLVMEYLHGEPLTDLLERGPLRAQQAVDILLPCLQGVEAAHRRGVIHRDLKPDNIFLCRTDEGVYLHPKVLDFGISKLSGSEAEPNPRLTRTGAVMGTPYYMSPEQIRGSHDVDGRCDIYALGVILYEAFTGKVPFCAETYSALVLEIATGTPDLPRKLNPELPEGLEKIVMRAMAREPEDRFADVRELALALAPYGGAGSALIERSDPTHPRPAVTAMPGGRGTSARTGVSSTPFSTVDLITDKPAKRRAWMAWVTGGALLVGIGAAALWGEASGSSAGTRGVVGAPAAEGERNVGSASSIAVGQPRAAGTLPVGVGLDSEATGRTPDDTEAAASSSVQSASAGAAPDTTSPFEALRDGVSSTASASADPQPGREARGTDGSAAVELSPSGGRRTGAGSAAGATGTGGAEPVAEMDAADARGGQDESDEDSARDQTAQRRPSGRLRAARRGSRKPSGASIARAEAENEAADPSPPPSVPRAQQRPHRGRTGTLSVDDF